MRGARSLLSKIPKKINFYIYQITYSYSKNIIFLKNKIKSMKNLIFNFMVRIDYNC